MPAIFSVTSVVRDMERTLDFYRLLGLAIPSEANVRGYASTDAGSGLVLAWQREDRERSVGSAWSPPTGSGRLRLVFRCGTPAEVDAVFRTLVDAGHRRVLEPFDARWGARTCRVLDPDGNDVDLFAALP